MHLACVVYINLKHRADRRAHITKQLEQLELSALSTRIEAVRHVVGQLGCGLSHIKALEYAAKQVEGDNDAVLVLEDDARWREKPQFSTVQAALDELERQVGNAWDVLLLGRSDIHYCTEELENGLRRVQHAGCTHAYVVRAGYIATLQAVFRDACATMRKVICAKSGVKEARQHLRKTGHGCIDVVWQRLQVTDRWYSYHPMLAVQIAGYSDILTHHRARVGK